MKSANVVTHLVESLGPQFNSLLFFVRHNLIFCIKNCVDGSDRGRLDAPSRYLCAGTGQNHEKKEY